VAGVAQFFRWEYSTASDSERVSGKMKSATLNDELKDGSPSVHRSSFRVHRFFLPARLPLAVLFKKSVG